MQGLRRGVQRPGPLGGVAAGLRGRPPQIGRSPEAPADADEEFLSSLVDEEAAGETVDVPPRAGRSKSSSGGGLKPKKKKKSKKQWAGPQFGFNVNRLNIIVATLGGCLLYMGFLESRLAAAAKPQPQRISCADLSARGPGDNAHVELTDFLLCQQAFVWEAESHAGENGPWTKVWVPVIPAGGPGQPMQMNGNFPFDFGPQPAAPVGPPGIPNNIKVIIKSRHVKNEHELGKLTVSPLPGLIVNKISKLGGEELKLLQQSYPGTDFKTCWILEEGRKPSSTGTMLAFFAGGFALLAAGGAWMLLGGRG